MKQILRKFKYKADQQGIANRYINQQENWASHLQNTKEFILESAESKNKNFAVVLGSGWWLDVPIAEICDIYNKVYLVDIIHPKQIVHKARKFENIEFIQTDLTGLTEKILEIVKNFKKNKQKPDLQELKNEIRNFGLPNEIQPDFVVSVNLLNQLDILLLSFLEKNNIYTETELQNFRTQIQQSHINSLPKNKSCLITDFHETNFNSNDVLQNEKKLVFAKFPKPKFEKQWDWKFDLNGNYRKNMKTIFKVKAMDF